MYQQSIDTDVEKGFVKILDESEVKVTFGKELYLPHHPVLNPNKPGKVRRVCNAASKYKEVCLNDKLLAGPDLLHGLIGAIFRFREGPIALTAETESMFLQVQVPEQDRGFCGVQELTNLFKYTNISDTYLELRVLQHVQITLSSEWDWIMKKCIQ